MTVIDCSVWVSRLLASEVNHALSRRWLNRHIESAAPIQLPMIVLAELSGAIARRTGSRTAAKEAVAEVVSLPSLTLVPLDEQLAALAADLASRLRTKGMDAIYLALALSQNLPLITWDSDQLRRGASIVRATTPS